MKRGVILVMISTMVLAGCSTGEPQKITRPVTVEEAKEEAAKSSQLPESLSEVSALSVSKMDIAEATVAKVAYVPELEQVDPNVVPEVTDYENSLSVAGEFYSEPEIVESNPEIETCTDFPEGEHGQYYYDIPDESSEAWYQEPVEEVVQSDPVDIGMQYLGTYYVTHYSAELCGNAIGARGRDGGLVEGESVAVPEYWMLGHWFYIDGYGTFIGDDICPDGIFDIFHWYAADAHGAEYRDVYLVG